MLKEKKEGLNYPKIDELLEVIDSRYKLAYIASKISTVIQEQNLDLSDADGITTLSKALNEIINRNFEITFQ